MLNRQRITTIIWITITIAAAIISIWNLATQHRDPLNIGPHPDAGSYAQQAIEMAKGNFFTIPWVHEVGEPVDLGQMNPSRYPPGYSFALAIFPALHGGTLGAVLFGAFIISALLVVATGYTALRVGGWPAALIGVIIAGSSPFVIGSSRMVLADAFGALLTVIALLLIWEAEHLPPSRKRVWIYIALGTVLGYSVLTKFALILTLAAAIIAIRNIRNLTWVIIGGAPWALLLALYQWRAYGSPIETGYDYWLPGLQTLGIQYPFDWNMRGEGPWIFNDQFNGALLSWTCTDCIPQKTVMGHTPPLITYPATLAGIYWIFLPPLFAGFGIYWAWIKRRTRTAQFAFVLIIINLVFFLFYFSQGVRFMAPAAFVLIVISAAGVVEAARRIRTRQTRHRVSVPPR